MLTKMCRDSSVCFLQTVSFFCFLFLNREGLDTEGVTVVRWSLSIRVQPQSCRLPYFVDGNLLFSNHAVALMGSAFLSTICCFCGSCVWGFNWLKSFKVTRASWACAVATRLLCLLHTHRLRLRTVALKLTSVACAIKMTHLSFFTNHKWAQASSASIILFLTRRLCWQMKPTSESSD